MAKTYKNRSDIHSEGRETRHPLLEDPLVAYNGDTHSAKANDTASVSIPRNRKAARRRISAFNIVLVLISTAVAIVLYVGNIIAVDQLLREINTLETKYQRIQADQEILRAQINRMSSLDRIQQQAENALDLKSLREPPVWLSVDQERIRQLEEETQKP